MKLPLLLLLVGGAACRRMWASQNNCIGRCGVRFDSSLACQCNTGCGRYRNCCRDYTRTCGTKASHSCQGKCGDKYDTSLPCQCNTGCEKYGNCCSDYANVCQSNTVTEKDMMELSERLLSLERNNVGDKLTLDLGCTTNNGNTQDCSPNKLFKNVDSSVFNLPIYQKLVALFDNYDRNVAVSEDHTSREQSEEREFIKAVMETDIMMETYKFLLSKGLYTGTYGAFEEKLYKMWFGMYIRAGGKLGTSGFEHVFLGEVKNNGVSGFHNWVRWYTEERDGHMNYLGQWNTARFGDDHKDGGGLEFTYTWDKVQKPYGSMFYGTSPELELALYTACFLAFPDKKCHVQLDGQNVYIQTWTIKYNGDVLVGSSYPDFHK